MLTQTSPGDAYCSSYLVKACCSDSPECLKSQLWLLFMFHCMYIFYHFYFSLSIRVTYGKTKFDSIGIGLEKIPGGELNVWQSRIKPALSLQSFKVGWASFTEMGILKTFTCCKFLNLLSCKQLSHNTWNGLSSLQNIWNLSLYIEVISGGMPVRGAGVLQYLLTCLRPKQLVNVGLFHVTFLSCIC